MCTYLHTIPYPISLLLRQYAKVTLSLCYVFTPKQFTNFDAFEDGTLDKAAFYPDLGLSWVKPRGGASMVNKTKKRYSSESTKPTEYLKTYKPKSRK